MYVNFYVNLIPWPSNSVNISESYSTNDNFLQFLSSSTHILWHQPILLILGWINLHEIRLNKKNQIRSHWIWSDQIGSDYISFGTYWKSFCQSFSHLESFSSHLGTFASHVRPFRSQSEPFRRHLEPSGNSFGSFTANWTIWK